MIVQSRAAVSHQDPERQKHMYLLSGPDLMPFYYVYLIFNKMDKPAQQRNKYVHMDKSIAIIQ